MPYDTEKKYSAKDVFPLESRMAMMAGKLFPKPATEPETGEECCQGGKTCSCDEKRSDFIRQLMGKILNDACDGEVIADMLIESEERYGRTYAAEIRKYIKDNKKWPLPLSC